MFDGWLQPKEWDHWQAEDLEQIVDHIEGEARMILPGIQALFGFQLIAVFNQRFNDLSPIAQYLHLFALVCTALSIVLALTPVAYHRQTEPDEVSTYFCRIGSSFLNLSLLSLAIGICVDFFVIAELITKSFIVSFVLTAIMLALFSAAWFLFPRRQIHYKNHAKS